MTVGNHLYRKLARHPGFWRVDGVGSLHDNGPLGARVKIQLSGIKEEFLDDPYCIESENGKKLDYLEHVASLQDFKVGTIWRDGSRVRRSTPHGAYEINTLNARFMKLGVDASFGQTYKGPLIPEAQFITGETRKNLLHSHYAQIPTLNNQEIDWLIIPCTEILRFYYGASRRLLSSIIQGKFSDYFSQELSRLESDKAVLHVKTRLSRKEAAVLARELFCPEKLYPIRRVHNYLSALSAKNSTLQKNIPLTIQSRFPFSDKTKISVSGKAIRLIPENQSASPQRALLVMEIFHCSYPFPFNRLVLESEKPFDSSGTDGEGLGTEHGARFTPEFEKDEDDNTLDLDSNVNADGRLKRLSEIIPTNQLGGIDNIKFEHSRPKNQSTYNEESLSTTVPVTGFTQNDGGYSADGKGNLGISHFLSHTSVARDLSVFLEMLTNIRSKKGADGWGIKTISFKEGVTLDGECICSFPLKVGKRRRWHLVTGENSETRPRQVILAEFIYAKEYIFYLIEMELQPDDSKQCTIIIKTKNLEPLKETTFDNFLKLSAIQRRWISPNHSWETTEYKKSAAELLSEIEIYRINHPKATKRDNKPPQTGTYIDPEKWADYLIEKIQELMNFD